MSRKTPHFTLATVIFIAVALLFSIQGGAHASEYSIDPDHSSVGFKVGHLGISSVTGKFMNFKGSFNFDPANTANSKTEARITAKSIDTEQAKRDDHLRGPDFLDTAKFPLIEFKSKEIREIEGDQFKVAGDLTIHGVTKPVVLDVAYGGSVKDPWGNERAAFSASTKISRKDFGITWNKLLDTGGVVVGDMVKIELEIEGVKKKV